MVSTLAAFTLYTVLVLGIGIWAARHPQETKEEIHLGDRDHGVWTSALSTSASTESGFVLIGMVGMGYSFGVSCFWMIPAGLLGYALNWYVLAPKLRFRSERLNAVTIPELILKSTGGTTTSKVAAALAAVFALVFLMTYVAAQFSAAGKAVSSHFPISYPVAVLTATTLIVLYAVLGGFRAVSWTDNVQAVMMVFALIVLPTLLLVRIGGPVRMLEILAAKDPALVSIAGGGNLSSSITLVLAWLMIGIGYPGQPHGITRLMAVRDADVIRRASVIAMIWMIIIYTGAVLLGMAARAGFENLGTIASDPETALPVLAVEILPGFLAGITLAAIIAAISSTADSQLIAAASTVTRDIRKAFRFPKFADELFVARVVIIILAALSAYFAVRQTHIVFKFVLYAFFGLGASLGPAVLYCSLAKKPHALAALLGIAVGGFLTFCVQSLALGFLVSFFAGLGVILGTHILCYRRVA